MTEEELRRIKYPDQLGVKKYLSKDGKTTTIVLPAPPLKHPALTNPQKNIEERLLDMAVKMVDKLIDLRIGEMKEIKMTQPPEWTKDIVQQIIQEVIKGVSGKVSGFSSLEQQMQAVKERDMTFETAEIATDRSKGHELKGSIGEEVFSNPEYTTDILKALETIEKRKKI